MPLAKGGGTAPIPPSERAQARLFTTMLRREIAQMTKKVVDAESAWQRRCDAEGYVDPPRRLAVVRERVAEMSRMLDALESRFPRRAQSR